jgi:uncharacterized protein (UPF0179 family)
MIVILLIVLSLVSIAAITIVVAQNTACKDCPFKRTCDELLNQNQLNLCQQNNMPSQNEEK